MEHKGFKNEFKRFIFSNNSIRFYLCKNIRIGLLILDLNRIWILKAFMLIGSITYNAKKR